MNAEPNRFFKNSSPKKVVNPPGGKSNDIFNTSPCQTQANTRKIRDNLKSSVFDTTDNGYQYMPTNPRPTQNGTESVGDDEKSASPKRFENTKDRLFGENNEISPRKCRMTDTHRSTLFQEDSGETITTNTPKKKISNGLAINPITGTPLKNDIGNTNGHLTNGDDVNGNVVTNGNGYHNGTSNGHHSHETTPVTNGQGKVFRRPPPGGFSSGIF